MNAVLPRRAQCRFPLVTVALRLALFVCCSMALLLASAQTAQAAAIVVNDAGDTPSAFCTLREAITNANNDDTSGSANCAPGSGSDTITFNAVLAGSTITLTSGPLTLTTDIGIFGDGVITVSADNLSRIFGTTGGSATLSGLTLRDGIADEGAAVHTTNGTLNIIDSVVISNAASGYGGGLFLHTATAIISDTQFISNTAGASGGGAAVMTTTLQLYGSSFMSNTALGSLIGDGGGGLWSNSALTQVGGIYQGNSSARDGGGLTAAGGYTLIDVNFVGNIAAFAGGGTHQFASAGPLPSSITGGTFQGNGANNGGAIYAYANPLVISGTLILSNTATQYGGGGGVFSYGQTRITDSLLQNNTNRAVYSHNALEIINSDFIKNSGSSGAGAFVNNNGGLKVSDSSFVQTSSGDSGGVFFINGVGMITNTLFLSNTGNTGGTIFAQGGTLTVTDSHFENNRASGQGGTIFSNSPITLKNTDFISNTSGQNGGAVWGHVTVTGGRFERNKAHSGGAIWSQGSTDSISGTLFISNTALTSGGGAMWANQSSTPITIKNSTFTGNVASGLGGGAIWANGQSVLDGVTFTNNTLTSGGGGALWANNTSTIHNSSFMSNTSVGWAGALFLQNTFTLSNTEFIANIAAGSGGGLARGGPSSTGSGLIVNSVFARNIAGGDGSAIAIETAGQVQVIFTTIGTPGILPGAAIAVNNTAKASITNTIVSGYIIGISQAGSATVSEDYNLFFANGLNTAGTVSSGGHSLVGFPAFANFAADDYRLTVPSAALGKGVDQGIYIDYFGNVRPQVSGADNGFDIGFHELAYTYDVALAKSVTPATVQPGGILTYTIAFSSTEIGKALGVVISDPLPDGVTITAITSSTIGSGVVITQTGGGPLPSADTTLSWEVSGLDFGEGGEITLVGVVEASESVAGTQLINTATITATKDFTATNNVGTAGVQVAPYLTIGGEVSGLEGSGLVLQNNGVDDLPINNDGSFTFATPQLEGTTYEVTVQTQPTDPLQECTVSNGSGTVASTDITNIAVTCTTLEAALEVVQTVGVDPSTCASGTDVTVFSGNTIYYCYTAQNTGALPLTDHTLEQSALGVIFANLDHILAPGATTDTVQLGKVISQTLEVSSSTVATWTSAVATPAFAATVTAEALDAAATTESTITVADAELAVQITVGTDSSSCGTVQSIIVPAGSQAYFCVTLTNTGAETLTDLTLRLTTGDVEFPDVTLAPGGTIQFTSEDTALLGPVTVNSLVSMAASVEALGDGTVLGVFTAESLVEATAAPQPTALEPGNQPQEEGIRRFIPFLRR